MGERRVAVTEAGAGEDELYIQGWKGAIIDVREREGMGLFQRGEEKEGREEGGEDGRERRKGEERAA